MAAWMLPAAIGGSALLGFMGQRDANASAERIANTPTVSKGQSSFVPHQAANPLYGYVGGISQTLGQTPTPFFPGPTYVGPSQPTQTAINMAMSGIQPANSAIKSLLNPGGGYSYAGHNRIGGTGGTSYADAISFAREGMPFFANAASYGEQGAPLYGQAATLGQQGVPLFKQAATLGQQAVPIYGQAAEFGQQGVPFFGQAAGMNTDASGAFSAASQAQQAMLPGAGRNYGFLSNAADLGNNPYVQGMLGANKSEVQDFLNTNLAKGAGSASRAGMLGGSADALMRGEAVGDAAEGLSRTNAAMLLSAYGQGLGAQQYALGQTPQMLQSQLAPAQARALAADQQSQAGQQYALGMGLQSAVGDQYARGMDAQSAVANQYRNAMDLQSLAGDQYGKGLSLLNLAGQQYGQGADQVGVQLSRQAQAAAQAEQAAAATAAANTAQRNAQTLAARTAADIQAQTLAQAYGAGTAVEGYQQAALQDAMARFAHQYGEPWQRMGNIGNALGLLQPLGTSYENFAGTGNTNALANVRSPFLAGVGGGLGGLQLAGSLGLLNQGRNLSPSAGANARLGSNNAGGLYGNGGFYDQRYGR